MYEYRTTTCPTQDLEATINEWASGSSKGDDIEFIALTEEAAPPGLGYDRQYVLVFRKPIK